MATTARRSLGSDAAHRSSVTRQQFLAIRTRVAVAEPRRETASKIVGLRRALNISGSGRGSSALVQVCYHCATSPVAVSAIRTREWPLSRIFVDFSGQYVRSGHYGEVCDFFGPYRGSLIPRQLGRRWINPSKGNARRAVDDTEH